MYHTSFINAYTALQSDNCTEPLSDSSNDQGPGTTDGPGDQVIDAIGVSNYLRILLKVGCINKFIYVT